MERILILNDDPTVTELIRRTILAHKPEGRKIKIVSAADVPEAQNKLITHTPALILADPGASEGIKNLVEVRQTEVACLTGFTKKDIGPDPLEVPVSDIIEFGTDGALTSWIQEWFEMAEMLLVS